MVVVDASVAVKWVLPESQSDAAGDLLAEELIAPAFWLVEAANVLWRRHRRNEMSLEQATARLLELLNAPVTAMPVETSVERAFAIAAELGHPVYDCLYLALALRHDTHVVTADRRFAVIAQRPAFADRVRLLGT